MTQRPRCWYFRLGYGLLGQKDGKSLVAAGDNRYHAIFGNAGPAYFVNPSSLAPALVAMDATFTIQGKTGPRKVKASDFFVIPKTDADRENVLQPTDILTEILLPAVPASSATYEVQQKMQTRLAAGVGGRGAESGGRHRQVRADRDGLRGADAHGAHEAAEAALVGQAGHRGDRRGGGRGGCQRRDAAQPERLQGAVGEGGGEARHPRGCKLRKMTARRRA